MKCFWPNVGNRKCGPAVALLTWNGQQGGPFPCCQSHVDYLCDTSDMLTGWAEQIPETTADDRADRVTELRFLRNMEMS